jgi:hypothetical protein
LINVSWDASRHFRNKKREYFKDKINELESNTKNKDIRDLYRGITEIKMGGYQPRFLNIELNPGGSIFTRTRQYMACADDMAVIR